MTTTSTASIVRNTAWFTFGSVGQKLFSFLHFTIIAMALGVPGTGRYFFALTFTALFSMIADWGIAPVVTREVARDRARGIALARFALRWKAAAMLCTGVAIAGVVAIAGYPPETVRAIAVATAALVIDSMHLLGYAVLRGVQRVHYEAVGTITAQAVVTALGVLALVRIAGLRFGETTLLATTRPIDTVWLLAPFVVASAVNLGIAIGGLAREGILRELRGGSVRASLPAQPSRWLLCTATPFAITAILARVYTYSDTFLLSLLANEVAVGYYSTPFKIAFAFQFIPLAYIGALYPAMSAVAARDPAARLADMFVTSVRGLLLIALPIAFGIGMLADRLLVMVYGPAFLPSAVPLVILAAAIPFTFVNFPAGYLLNAIDRQTVNTALVAIATGGNILLNLFLIPAWGATGAALAALAATVLLTAMNFAMVRRHAPYRAHTILHPLLRTLAACLTMSALVLLTPMLPLGVRIFLGACAYGLAAIAFRVIRRTDFAYVRDALRHRTRVIPEAITP